MRQSDCGLKLLLATKPPKRWALGRYGLPHVASVYLCMRYVLACYSSAVH